jgi:hypothetical protein
LTLCRFALPAGAGDVIVGLLALGIGIGAFRGRQLRSRTVPRWNLLGVADLVIALTTGFLTTPSPLQKFAFDHPNELISVFPMVLIPTFLVPLAILLHVISLIQLRRATTQPDLAADGRWQLQFSLGCLKRDPSGGAVTECRGWMAPVLGISADASIGSSAPVKQFLTFIQIMHLVRVLARCKLASWKQLIEDKVMTQFQKIAIGLLGLTHPEMFIPKPKAAQSSAKITSDDDSTKPIRPQDGQVARMIRAVRFMLAALAIGSRTVALADNSQLRSDLGARARLLYGSDEV